MKKSMALVAVISLFLAGCGTSPSKKAVKTGNTVSKGNVAAAAYADNKRALSKGLVIASSNNACVDSFNFLKGVNQSQYSAYSVNYNKIHQNYSFLNINKEIMDQDAKALLAMTLNKKLDTLCTKVQYDGFVAVKDRIKTLSNI